MAQLLPLPTCWITSPPLGTRLHLADVAEALRLGLDVLAKAIKCEILVVRGIAHRNSWPARQDRQHLEARICDVLRIAGASPQDLAALFYAPAVPTPLPKPRAVRAVPRAAAAEAAQPRPSEEEPDMLLPKASLTQQALKHFKLFTDPFGGPVLRPEQLYLNDDSRFVREFIWQGARNSGFMALVGESGAGKTTILEDMSERLHKEARDVVVIRPSVLGMEASERAGKMLKSNDILHAIVAEIDPAVQVNQTLQGRTLQAQRMLNSSAQAGNFHLLVLEEAHGLPDPTMKHLKRLHELRIGRRPLLGILLVAQPELKRRLADGLRSGALREVAQRCEVVEMLPLGRDLGAYLRHRAAAAGRPLDTFMDQGAIDQLGRRLQRKLGSATVDLSYPLAVGNAVISAMNLAAALGVAVVTADVIKEI